MILAKQNITLEGHSNRVAKYAEALYKVLMPNDTEEYQNILEVISLSAKLHDIGKYTEEFQNLLLSKSSNSQSKFRHNEIGWAILQKYFKHKDKDIISSAVYWHHGISNKMKGSSVDDILSNIKEDNEKNIAIFLKKFIGDEYIEKNTKSSYTKSAPAYFDDDEVINNKNLIIRTCIISSDRIVSELESNILKELESNILKEIDINEIENIVDARLINPEEYILSMDKKTPLLVDNVDNIYNIYGYNDRYKKQHEIVKECGQTTIINAPGGFGKTTIGLLFSAENDKQLLWVCPGNSIANSAYDRIKEELCNLGLNNIKIELYLTGAVIKSNHNNKDGFVSDIIITNIDNYLKPTIDNSYMNKLHMILSSDVVFDEYDVFVTDAALFAGFINIMQTRHRFTNSRTVLLSATPADIEMYWDNDYKKTVILPCKYSHYNAAHDKKYIIKSGGSIDLNDAKNKLVIVNSTSLAQTLHRDNKNTILIHSKFEKNKKDELFECLYNRYGKHSILDKNINVISTNILQASFDISFKELCDNVISPSSTIQRIARINRWGEYDDNEAVINLIKIVHGHVSEKKMVDILYDKDLSKKWYEYMTEIVESENSHDLNSLYIIYNKFQKNNKTQISEYIRKKYSESFKYLGEIYPIKYNTEDKEDNDIITAGSNKLRCTGNEVFIIAKKYNTDAYCDPFNVEIYYNSFTKTFKEKNNIESKIKNEIKELLSDERFGYDKLLNKKKEIKVSLEDIQKIYAKKSDTPYIRFDKEYHDDYGFIESSFLD